MTTETVRNMKAYIGKKVSGVVFASLFGTVCAASATPAYAEDLYVLTSGGFTPAYQTLGKGFEKQTGVKLVTVLGPSMGKAHDAIPNRLQRGETADVVIMVGYALDKLIKDGEVVPGSRVELSDSRIGMDVKEGQPKPDISSVAAFKETLLHAKSIAYSDSASGVYVQNELFKKLGIESQVAPKAKMIQQTPVASVVAKGDYEIGFQQVSELLPIKGSTFVGKIPESLQSVTRYAAGIPVASKHQKEAKALLAYMSSPAAQPAIRATGMDSVPQK